MNGNVHKVLRVNAVEEQTDYRNAIAEILRNIQNDFDITLLEISEIIDVSLGTVSNAANKKNDLNAIYLKRLGKAFGAAALDPYARLYDGRNLELDGPEGVDVLPTLNMASYRISTARSPTSEGGTVETLRERLGYLPDLRRAQREIGALISEIEARKAA